MKKHIFLSILFLFVSFCFIWHIDSYASNSDFTYKLDSNNNAIITAYKGTNSIITIPSTLDGHAVKSIGTHAFDENRNTTNGKILTQVTISEGITAIEDYAFIDCINLESIFLPESMDSLGKFTFIGCVKLHEINIPSNLKRLEEFVFQDTGFTEFTIPEGFEYIGDAAFRSCKNLTSFKVYSDAVTYYDNTSENVYDPVSGGFVSPEPKNTIFEYCSKPIIFYGNESSSTKNYSQLHKLQFKLLSEYQTPSPEEPLPDPDAPKPDIPGADVPKLNASTTDIDNTNPSNDTTTANKILPKAGVSYCLLLLVVLIVFAIFFHRKYNEF